jgi:hypothetical protein
MTQKYTMPKGDARMAVEDALRTATRANPITPQQVAKLTGLPITTVRSHVANCANTHLAHNVHAAGQVGAAYAWGPKPEPRKAGNVALPRTGSMSGTYDGRDLRPFDARGGAMDAFDKSSDGRPRVKPMIIGGKPEQRV